MGRGRPFAGHKIVPPVGARWAPKPNARARCIRSKLLGKTGARLDFSFGPGKTASDECKIRGS